MAEQVKALVTVSGQFGMGEFWYPCWYRPRKGNLLSMLNYKWGAFPPLISKRDRHDILQYKGPVYAKTLWTVQTWTDANLAKAGKIEVPFNLTMASKDKVVSPARNRQFFDSVASKEKVKHEFNVGHEILANEEINLKVIQSQIAWLSDKL